MRVKLAVLLAGLVAAGLSLAQDRPAFDAASVKAVPHASRQYGIRILPGGLTAEAASLHSLITLAYGLTDYQLSGLSGWMDSEFFNVVAKTAGPVDQTRMKAMLRTLVEDRFQFKTHTVIRSTPVFFLMQAKGGVKFPALKEGEEFGVPESLQSPDHMTLSWGPGIATLVYTLNHRKDYLGRMVIDRTGLEGRYKIWVTFENHTDPDGKSGRLDMDIPSALPQQLGLKLEPAQADVPILVIDHAERPTAQ